MTQLLEKEIKLDKNTIIVSETNQDGIILYANEDFCKICGYTKDEIIGKPHNIIRHPDMPKIAFKELWQTIKSGNIWQGLVKNLTKDGAFYWVYSKIYPSKTIDGKIRYVSVRVKPTENEIASAIKLYQRLS